MKRIPLNDVSREQWLAMRQAYIGASEVAVVCGEAQWGSLAELYAEKKGLRPPREETPPMRRGRILERAAFDWLSEERPEWEVKRASVFVVDEERRQACTPDGFAQAPGRGIGVVQAKVVSRTVYRRKWLDDPNEIGGSATPPAYYVMQTVQEMRLNELEWGVLAVLIEGEFGSDFAIFDIERNAVLEERIDYHVADFFARYFDPGIMPPFEPQRDEQLIKTLYPQDDGTHRRPHRRQQGNDAHRRSDRNAGGLEAIARRGNDAQNRARGEARPAHLRQARRWALHFLEATEPERLCRRALGLSNIPHP